MSEQQLDFFSDIGIGVGHPLSQNIADHTLLSAGTMDDETLIAAIPESTLVDTYSLAVEAGRRRLVAAVPALAALCRRFAGFGTRHKVSEQAAAIEALAMIGGRDAGRAVSEMIERAVVQGPTLQIAVSAAARLGSTSLFECPAATATRRRAIYSCRCLSLCSCLAGVDLDFDRSPRRPGPESGNGGRLSPRSNWKDRGSPDPERPSAGCSIGRPDGSSVTDRR